jgi:hypothetical protein
MERLSGTSNGGRFIELANRKLPVVTGGNASSEASHFSQQQARKI